MKTKILITIGYKHRELAYMGLLVYFLQQAGFEVKVKYANFEVYGFILKWRPDIVILGQVTQSENIAVGEYAHQTGARVVVINCEGTYNPNKEVRRFGKVVNHFVDVMTAWGQQHYTDALRFSDLATEKVVITGTPKMDLYHPVFDELYQRQPVYQGRLNPRKKTICICTSFASADQSWEHVKKNNVYADMGEEENRRIVAGQKKLRDEFIALGKQLATSQRYNVIFRIHPLESSQYYQQQLRPVMKQIIFDNTVTPQQLLPVLDLLIHRTSTVATEAWIKGVATVSFDPIYNDDSEILEFTAYNPMFHRLAEVVDYVHSFLARPRHSDRFKSQKTTYLTQWYSFDRAKPMLASHTITKLLLRLKPQPKKFVAHRYLVIHALLYLAKLLLGKRYVYEVIGMIKGEEYLQVMRHNYILDSDVENQVELYRSIFDQKCHHAH